MDPVARPFRSVLYIPASNERALEKARDLPADAIIFDLEDAVAEGATHLRIGTAITGNRPVAG